jgi:hypothetical protein
MTKTQKTSIIRTLKRLYKIFLKIYESENYVYLSKEDNVLWINDICCIFFEEDLGYTIQFDVDSDPSEVANITKKLIESNLEFEIFESFWFDEDHQIHFVSDDEDIPDYTLN